MLLQDVLFVLNGINGTHVQLEEVPSLAPDSVIPHQASMREKVTRVVFMDDGSHVIPMPTQQLIHRIAELGRLYRHISGFVEARLQDAATGLAMQALCSFVDEELRDYYRLVATLESQLKDVEKRAVPAAGEVQKSTTAGVSTQLTLQRLAIWTSDTLLRMRLLSTIIEACKDAKGGALASIIDAYSVNGDPLIQSLIEALLDRVTRPMFKTLAKWIFEGELDDPFQEFFVQVNADYGPNAFAIPTLGVVDEGLATYDAASFWQHRFSMRPEMLPTFISTQFGRKIFATGKSLNFVRYACGSSDWISAQAFHKRDHDLRYSDLDGLERAVDKAHAIVSKHLGDIFLDKLHLVQHLRAMRDYLMLGRGDFVDLLREQLQEYLNQPSSLLQRHNVTMALESAIRRSSAQYDSSDITRRLDAKILEDSAGDVGWDVFTIEYKVDSPVNTVLDGPAMQAYQIIFGHLWRIKRTEVAVSNAWHTLTAARGVLRDLRRRTPLAEALHAVAEVALLRLHEMNHMVGQLQSYVQLECCAYSWEDLMGSLRDEVDLDELINLHRKYVEALIAKILLRTSSRRGHDPDFLASEVRTAMHVIRSYAELCLQLANLAYNWSAAISPGSGEIDPTVQQQMPVEIEKLSTRLAEQSTRFRERLQTISDGLDKHPNLVRLRLLIGKFCTTDAPLSRRSSETCRLV